MVFSKNGAEREKFDFGFFVKKNPKSNFSLSGDFSFPRLPADVY
jgi:hypothetical protein